MTRVLSKLDQNLQFKMNKENTNSDDLILRQPEVIVNRILSCLNFKDLVRTSILSKKWRNLYITASPELILEHKFFNFVWMDDYDKTIAKTERLMNFVERTLSSRHSQMISLERLVLVVTIYNSKTATSLDRCISYAIGCNVKHLDLNISYRVSSTLPHTVFATKSIIVLKLSGLHLGSSSCANMNLSSLKTLCLKVVSVDSIQILQNLLASCPVIEHLCASNCQLLKGALNICGLVNPKLALVQIYQCRFDRVEIEAPSLQTFYFHQLFHSTPCEIDVSTCKNIRELRLYGATITDNSFNHLLSRLSHLEMLSLHNCDMVETIKITRCGLKNLVVGGCRKLVKVEIDDPNLSSFSYTGGENVISFSSNALDLSIKISLHSSNLDTLWYVKLIELLRRFNTAKVLTLHTNFHKNVIVPRELRESMLSPLHNVEHLILDINLEPPSQAIEEIIDGLLWLSPHPVTVSIESFHGKRTLELTFLYDEGDREGNSCGCFSLPTTCWRHCSREVKIKSSGRAGEEVERNVKTFLELAKMSKIDGFTI